MRAKQKQIQVNKGREHPLRKACSTRYARGSALGWEQIPSGSNSNPWEGKKKAQEMVNIKDDVGRFFS